MSTKFTTVAGLSFAVGCAPKDYHECQRVEYVSLTLRGTGWTDIGDNVMHIRVFETKDGWVEQSEQTELKASGELEHLFQCGLDDGGAYTVAWYIDTNEEFGCQRQDKVWSEELGTVTDDVLLEIDPEDPEDNTACDHF